MNGAKPTMDQHIKRLVALGGIESNVPDGPLCRLIAKTDASVRSEQYSDALIRVIESSRPKWFSTYLFTNLDHSILLEWFEQNTNNEHNYSMHRGHALICFYKWQLANVNTLRRTFPQNTFRAIICDACAHDQIDDYFDIYDMWHA